MSTAPRRKNKRKIMNSQASRWYLALSISLLLHITALVVIPKVALKKTLTTKNIKQKDIEIITTSLKEIPHKKETAHNNKPLNTIKPPPYIKNLANKINIGNKNHVTMKKPKILDNSLKSIILAGLPREKELKKNPAYMDYYHLIREKIRVNAYRYYNSSSQGQVFLTFIVSNGGNLEEIYLNATSSENKELTEIALKSIKEAAPFPPFPPELNYPRLQFNVSIYFKNN